MGFKDLTLKRRVLIFSTSIVALAVIVFLIVFFVLRAVNNSNNSTNITTTKDTPPPFILNKDTIQVTDLVWPAPQSITLLGNVNNTTFLEIGGQLLLNTIVSANSLDTAIATDAFKRFVGRIQTKCPLSVSPSSPSSVKYTPTRIQVTITDSSFVLHGAQNLANINETYSLLITNNGYINVTAPTVIGIVYAFETLSQLTLTNSTSCFVAAVSVMDSPRFPHRGLLLDTARNFFPVSDIKRQMDAMGSAKMNVFHWHVYDAQSFPLTWAYGDNGALFKAGAYRTNYSSGASGSYKVYSQSDINDLVQYALYRGIRIIPEFDIPGHSAVFGDAYPELMSCVNASPWTGNCAQPPCGQFNPSSPGVYSFLESFLIDMSQWFPDPVIHLGMDEVSAKCWNTTGLNDPVFKKSIKDFVTRVAAVVQANGKRLMGWDEMIRSYSLSSFPGGVGSSILPQDTMIQVWEGAKGGAIDITQSNLTLADDQTQNMISIAVSLGYSVVASPSSAWYLDCSSHQTWCASTDNSNGGSKAVWHDWKKVYDYDPTSNLSETLSPSQITTSVMGGEGCMWSETLKRDNIDGMIWPRAAAVAERLWSPQLIAVRTNRTEARLDRFRASLVNQYNISASLTGDLVGEIQVGGKYMVEWCDFNLNSPAQRSSDGSNYCSNAASYDTQTIVPTIPSPIVYPY